MKISDFVPEIASRDANLVQANTFLNKVYDGGFDKFMKSSSGTTSQAQPYGIKVYSALQE
jgi:hypothetical protein